MALIIENGTGVANAQAWADVTSCITFATSYYGASLTGSTAEKEATILRTVNFMNSLNWLGDPTFGRAQELAWPRTGVDDIGVNEIPREVIKAQHILARAEHAAIGTLAPSGSSGGQVIKEKVDVIEITYAETQGGVEAERVTVTDAMDLLAPFLQGTTPKLGAGWY